MYTHEKRLNNAKEKLCNGFSAVIGVLCKHSYAADGSNAIKKLFGISNSAQGYSPCNQLEESFFGVKRARLDICIIT